MADAPFARADLGLTFPNKPTVRVVPPEPPPKRVPIAANPINGQSAPHLEPYVDANSGRAEQRRRNLDQLRRELGPIVEMLKDPDVSDIHRNPDGCILVSKVGQGIDLFPSGYRMSDDHAMQIIAIVAGFMKTECSPAKPILLGSLPLDGSRFSAVVPPVSRPGPLFTIRKHAILVRSFENYIETGAMTREQAQFLRKRINARDNFLIVGGTGSGKTTLGNAVLREMAESSTLDDRFLIMEDTPELQCPAQNLVYLLTDDASGTDMDKLLATTLRLSPTRICIGELRGKEAAILIEAWNTGHQGGLTTIHSKTAASGLVRLETLIRKANIPPNKVEIAAAVKTVVVIEQLQGLGFRKITEIKRVTGATDREYSLSDR